MDFVPIRYNEEDVFEEEQVHRSAIPLYPTIYSTLQEMRITTTTPKPKTYNRMKIPNAPIRNIQNTPIRRGPPLPMLDDLFNDLPKDTIDQRI